LGLGWESQAWEEGTGNIITMGTCSICGKSCPLQEMAVNINIIEVRCKDCFKKYGNVPLETLCAALCVYGMHIYDLSEDDLDILVALQKKKIDLNRKTERKIIGTVNALRGVGREKRLEDVQKKANNQRAKINQRINGTIKKMI